MKANSWLSLRKETHKEIMNTDIMCEILYTPGEEALAEKCMDDVFLRLKEFELRFSRFQKDNELWEFNQSSGGTLSADFFSLLSAAKYFYTETDELFDPSILPHLESEGYKSTIYSSPITQSESRGLTHLTLDSKTQSAKKPASMMLDLGGIGKGFIVDQVATTLSQHFDNFIIDAGGDIYVHGRNTKEDYPYFVVEVEHPDAQNDPVALLLLKDLAVATSGRNRRHWLQAGEDKHHIIDPRTKKSATSDFLSVTVIAGSTVCADVLAKVLFISGKTDAYSLAERWKIPALFVESDGRTVINSYAQPYVWKN